MKRNSLPGFLLLARLAGAQPIELTPVVQKPVSRTITLPGELEPFMSVVLRAKVEGFVERVLVDRGSVVKQGDLLVELSAPEMESRILEAQSRVPPYESERLQAEAQRSAAQSTLERLRKAAETPGAVAGNEIVQVQRQVDSLDALVKSKQQAKQAAESAVRNLKDLQAYLKIAAPFDGVITERMVHPGALAGPGGTGGLLMLQQLSRLRLVVAVPEEEVSGVVKGSKVEFRVPAYADRRFVGVVARNGRVLDPRTRTMAVELDAGNADGALSPGMYPAVKWPVRRTKPVLYVPKTSVVATTERVFVIRNKDGKAEWVDVQKGAADGDFIEVSSANLRAGDMVAKRASDELREGTPVKSK